MSKTNYESAVNLALWAEIKAQFKPYNPNGKESSKSLTPVKHQIGTGEVRKEFLQGQQRARIDFQRERAEEEKQNLNFLNPENPEIEGEMRRELDLAEQERIEREIERKKAEKEIAEADAALALKLQQEEREREDEERKREREATDRQYAKQLARQLEEEERAGKAKTSKYPPVVNKKQYTDAELRKRERERQEETDRQYARQIQKEIEAEEAAKWVGTGVPKPTSSKYTGLSYAPVVSKNPYKDAELSNREKDKKEQEKADAELAKKLAAEFSQISPRNKSPKIGKSSSPRSPIKSHFRSKGVKRARVSSSDSSGSSDNLYTGFPSKHVNAKPPLDESESETDGTPSPTSLYDSGDGTNYLTFKGRVFFRCFVFQRIFR